MQVKLRRKVASFQNNFKQICASQENRSEEWSEESAFVEKVSHCGGKQKITFTLRTSAVTRQVVPSLFFNFFFLLFRKFFIFYAYFLAKNNKRLHQNI